MNDEKKTTRAQDEAATPKAHDPFAAWKSITRENVERMEAMFGEADRIEAESLQRTKQAMDESARLVLESMAWATRASAEWRKLMLGGMRRTAEG